IEGVLHQALIAHDIEHRLAYSGRNRIAAERVEIPRPVAEIDEQFVAGHHPGQRMAVAHGLAQRYDIGSDRMALEAPHVIADATEARLDLVGDVQSASLAH